VEEAVEPNELLHLEDNVGLPSNEDTQQNLPENVPDSIDNQILPDMANDASQDIEISNGQAEPIPGNDVTTNAASPSDDPLEEVVVINSKTDREKSHNTL